VRRALIAATVAAALLEPSGASAHGRDPVVVAIAVDPHDPLHVVAAASFGLLTSMDGGERWAWVCTEAYRASPNANPSLAFTDEGELLIATGTGVYVTREGCDFAPLAVDEPLLDLTRDVDGRVLGLGFDAVHAVGGGPVTASVPAEVGTPRGLALSTTDAALAVTGSGDASAVWTEAAWQVTRVPLQSGERGLDVLHLDTERAVVVALRDPRDVRATRVVEVRRDGVTTERATLLAPRAALQLPEGLAIFGAGGTLLDFELVDTHELATATADPRGGIWLGGRTYAGFGVAHASRVDAVREARFVASDLDDPFPCDAASHATSTCGAAWDDVVLDLGLDGDLLGAGQAPPHDDVGGAGGCAVHAGTHPGGAAIVACFVLARRARRHDGRSGRTRSGTTPRSHRAARARGADE